MSQCKGCSYLPAEFYMCRLFRESKWKCPCGDCLVKAMCDKRCGKQLKALAMLRGKRKKDGFII